MQMCVRERVSVCAMERMGDGEMVKERESERERACVKERKG